MRISDWSSDVCSSDLGRIDVLCNNAGGGTGAGPVDQTPVAELSLDDWRYTYAVSLDSAFLCAKHAVPHLERQGGAIVNKTRSEERRVGKECVSPCGSRWSPYI